MKKVLTIISLLILLLQCKSIKTEENTKLKVAIFNGLGASETCISETYEALKIDTGIITNYISASEINLGKIQQYDVVIFPGGSASNQLNNIGEQSAEKIKEFIKNGGGLVGICAGGYLLSTTKNYPSLEIVSATEWDRKHYDKGRALVEFKLTDLGLEVFPELLNKKCFLQYFDGPVFMPSDSGKSGLQSYKEFAIYISDIAIKPDYPIGITPGKTFLLGENIGKGKAMVIAGHPEATPGMRWMLPRMVRWTAGKELIKYHQKWINPQMYDSAIFYSTELIGYEKSNFWKLLSQKPQDKLEAMHELQKIKSRQGVRWNIGLLRDNSKEVRALAAELILKNEYSAAIKDIENALNIETDSLTKITLQKTFNYLKTF
jgi:hypothetical protein